MALTDKKICKDCRAEKPICEFNKNKQCRLGVAVSHPTCNLVKGKKTPQELEASNGTY